MWISPRFPFSFPAIRLLLLKCKLDMVLYIKRAKQAQSKAAAATAKELKLLFVACLTASDYFNHLLRFKRYRRAVVFMVLHIIIVAIEWVKRNLLGLASPPSQDMGSETATSLLPRRRRRWKQAE